MTSAATIIAALGGNQRNGICLCPAHDDQNPSLHVSDGRNRVVFFCHAGCSQEAVMAALQQRGLLQTKQNRVRRPSTVTVASTGTEHIAVELGDAAEETGESPTAYLRRRGISISPSVLKLVGAGVMHFITGKMLPAMIAPVSDKDGRIIGVQVTYLTADAKDNAVGKHGKVRRMFGEIAGGLVVLKSADPEQPFILGEGIDESGGAKTDHGSGGIVPLRAA
ncbi:MAG: hypothetical protein KL801_17560 [Mesorhizobium sp.]|nr:hypothetical protein [Mesorhizobium sp.]